MTNLFLRAKHWQLFLLGFGAPFVLIIVMMVLLYLSTLEGEKPSQALVIGFFVAYILGTLASTFTLFGLLYSITTSFDKLIPNELKLNIKRFRIAFWIPIMYTTLVLLVMIFLAAFVSLAELYVSASIFIFIFPLHFLAMFCIFYCLFISAKTIKLADVQRRVGFGDFVGEFALLWFFPMGIWLIQPTVNKLSVILDDENTDFNQNQSSRKNQA